MTKLPYHVSNPVSPRLPIVVSVPHCGTEFPDDIREHLIPESIQNPDDTDFHVERLYNFAPEMGITLIQARFNRWVIDLNRSTDQVPLYQDGRLTTGLCPTHDFFGNPIYKNPKLEPDKQEVKRRISQYYTPYYEQLTSLLQDLKQEFGKVLLWDAHSIRSMIPTITKNPFPDLILGSNNRRSADSVLIEMALHKLGSAQWKLQHNDPFQGGNITRYFGQPNKQVNALQLEMVKKLYLGDCELKFNPLRAEKIKPLLLKTLTALGKYLIENE